MVSRLDQENEGLLNERPLSRFPMLARAGRTNGESLMISTTLMGLAVLTLGFCIGFVWGELKASREIDFTLRRNEINELRKMQNSLPGEVRKEVRTLESK